MDRSKQLGEESIGKLLWKFSLPAIVGMMVNALYNIVDRVFVGRGVGIVGISATTVAFPIAIIIMAFSMLVGIGAAATISIKLGQNRKKEAEHIMGNAFFMLIIVSLIVTFFGIVFMNPLLRTFGASEDVMPLARQYISIILLGAILQSIGFGMNNIIRSEGNPKMAMATMLIGAILNTILNPIFIFGFKVGIRGSALATIISETVCSVWVMYYFLKGNSLLKFKRENLKLKFYIVKQIFAIGMSPFLMQLVSGCVIVILNNSLKRYGGDTAIAAMGIINSISLLILMPVFGINQGSQPIIGYNYGAKNYSRVKKALRFAICAATSVTTFGFLIIELFPGAIMQLFTSTNAGLLNIGVPGMRVYLCMMPIIGFQIVSSNYFEAVGKARKSIILSMSRQVIVLIPLLIILPRLLKLKGVWMAGASSDFIASLITGYFILNEMKNLK